MSKKFKFGVIGSPIEHSLSPFIHSRFARQQNLNIDYQAFKVEEINFDSFIKEFFSDMTSKGLNVTLPLKNLAANIDGVISQEAKFINAVNTITKSNRNFKLESTDGMGLMADLKYKEIDIAGKNILIVGAGAAVESILFRLARSNPAKINIHNRTKEKAHRLCSNYPNHNVVFASEEGDEYDIIINGSSAGLTGSFNPPKGITASTKTIFYDLNYSLGKTPFCEWALESSKSVYDGTGMLVNQAAQSFKLWFGVTPEIDRVLEDLKSLTK
jgi:shikimate dehydrogenase